MKFVKFVNQTSQTLEIDESEAAHHESESLRFVEFAVQFVREIRKIRLQISPAGHFPVVAEGTGKTAQNAGAQEKQVYNVRQTKACPID